MPACLLPQITHGLQRLIGALDALAVHLERPLRLDQSDELRHRIDIAGFQIILQGLAGAEIAGVGDDRRAGGVGFGE